LRPRRFSTRGDRGDIGEGEGESCRLELLLDLEDFLVLEDLLDLDDDLDDDRLLLRHRPLLWRPYLQLASLM
jgi:hypothetical protein